MALSATQLNEFYVAYFGRPADVGGLNFFLNSNATAEQIGAAFVSSAESQALFGASSVSATVAVTAFYQNLFNRAPEPAGLQYWINQIQTGAFSIAAAALAIANAAQNSDATTVANKVQIANAFYADLNNTAYINGYAGSTAAASARAFLKTITSTTNVATSQSSVDAAVAAAVGVTVPVSGGGGGGSVVGATVTLTTGVDNITLTGNNNTVNGNVHNSVPALDTFSAGDTISGTGTGNVLNLTDTRTGQTWTALGTAVTVSGIQTLNLISGEPTAANTVTTAEGFAGLTALNATLVGGSAITAANTTAISVLDSGAFGATESVQGGSSVTLTANKVTSGGTINIGTTTAPTGAIVVTLNELPTQTGFVTADALTIKGGTTVSVTANLNGAVGVGNTVTGGTINVTGTSTTTSVTLNQTAAATASATVGGVVDGAVTINDVNAGSTTAAGKITSVSLANYGTAAINDNALTTLTLAGNGGALTLTDALTVPTVTTLALNVNGLNATSFNDANNEITTLKVVTGGTTGSTIATLTDTGLTTLSVSGTQQLTLGTAPTSLTSVAVSGGAGVNMTLGAATNFVSTSTGTDVLTISAAATQTLTGNGTANEEIIWNGVTSPAAAAYLGTATGFRVLGIGSAVTAGEIFDMSKISGFTGYDVQANTQTGTVQLSNVTAGSPLAIDGAFAGTLSYATADTAGPTDSLALKLGGSTVGAFTVGTLKLADSAANGIGNVSVTSTTATGLATVNTITSFQDASLTTLNLAGNAGLTFSSNVATNAASLTINGTSTGTGGISFNGGITDASLLNLTLTGTNKISLGTVSHGTGGITIAGGSDDANISLALAGVTAAGKADVVTLGNGNNVVTDTAAGAGSTVTINLGNGNNTVTVGATATNTVNVGTGANTIIEAAGGNVALTFGAHSSTVVDNIIVGAATSATITPSAVITGFNDNGADRITFSGDAGATGAINIFTATQINTFGSTLAAAVAGVLASGGGNLPQHAIAEFQFQGNTYFVEQAGATGSAFAAGDTIVELVGVHTLTTATTATAGVLSLHG